MTRTRLQGRKCSDCEIGITDQSTTGKCKRCFMRGVGSDRETISRRAATVKYKCRTVQGYLANKARVVNANRNKAMLANPERWELFWSDLTPEQEQRRRAALIAFNKRDRLPWLPDDRRDDYFTLIKNRRFTAREAKEIILNEIAAKHRAAEARLSPFERQERAIQRGGQLVANDTVPSLYDARMRG